MRAAVIGCGPVGRFVAARLGVTPLGRDVLPSDDVQVVVLAVPDRSIADLAVHLRKHGEWALIHCSGACSLADLGNGAAAVWHPMRAFASADVIPPSLDGAIVGLRGDEHLVAWLRQQTIAWGGVPVSIAEEHAVNIHAACCFAAGFIASVAAHAQTLMVSSGLSDEEARQAIECLSSSAIKQVLGGLGLTGPAVRGDLVTLEAHLGVLGPLANLYRELSLSMGAHHELDSRIEQRLTSVD